MGRGFETILNGAKAQKGESEWMTSAQMRVSILRAWTLGAAFLCVGYHQWMIAGMGI